MLYLFRTFLILHVLLSVSPGHQSYFHLFFFFSYVISNLICGTVVISFSLWLQQVSRLSDPRLLAPDSYLSSPWSGWLAPCCREHWCGFMGAVYGGLFSLIITEKPHCGGLRAVSGPVGSWRLPTSALTGRQQIAWALVGLGWWGQMGFGGVGESPCRM